MELVFYAFYIYLYIIHKEQRNFLHLAELHLLVISYKEIINLQNFQINKKFFKSHFTICIKYTGKITFKKIF